MARHLAVSVAILLATAVIARLTGAPWLLTAALLIVPPALDRGFPAETFARERRLSAWRPVAVAACALLLLVALRPSLAPFALATLLLTALPEEWFFRAWLQQGMGNDLRAVGVSSLIFASIHGVMLSGEMAVLVLPPSLLFGLLHWRWPSLWLVVLAHAAANLFPRQY